MNESDRAFLLSLNGLEPDWSIYDFHEFPSVKWKLLNLEKFKQDKPEIYQQQIDALKGVLEQYVSQRGGYSVEQRAFQPRKGHLSNKYKLGFQRHE